MQKSIVCAKSGRTNSCKLSKQDKAARIAASKQNAVKKQRWDRLREIDRRQSKLRELTLDAQLAGDEVNPEWAEEYRNLREEKAGLEAQRGAARTSASA